MALSYNAAEDLVGRNLKAGRGAKIAYIDVHDIREQPPTDAIMAALDKLK